VTTPDRDGIRRRRRGPELEAALLEAAWGELVDVGYAGLTMESVAARARTGVAVLYRRWANKDQLTFDAIKHYRASRPVTIRDTGTLRGDLLALLTDMSKTRATFTAVSAGAAYAGLGADRGMTPARVRETLLGGRPMAGAEAIYRRADERGEIELSRVPPAVLAMPFDLVRHDLLMNLKPLKPARIRSILDEMFLPLVLAPQPG
jgi:AcrR family transcriptional regulator